MPDYVSTIRTGAKIWVSGMAVLSLLLAGHLFYLLIREFRRNLRFDAERERLGWKCGPKTVNRYPFRPKYLPGQCLAASVSSTGVNLSQPWTATSGMAGDLVATSAATATAIAGGASTRPAITILLAPGNRQTHPA